MIQIVSVSPALTFLGSWAPILALAGLILVAYALWDEVGHRVSKASVVALVLGFGFVVYMPYDMCAQPNLPWWAAILWMCGI
jgi:hypothetical protein